MKLLFTCLLIFTGLVAINDSFAQGYAVVAPNGLSIRSEPSLTSKRLSKAAYGLRINVLDQRESAEWVFYDGLYTPFYKVSIEQYDDQLKKRLPPLEGFALGAFINAPLAKPNRLPKEELAQFKAYESYSYEFESVVGHTIFTVQDSIESAFLYAKSSKCDLDYDVEVLEHQPQLEKYVFPHPEKTSNHRSRDIMIIRDGNTKNIKLISAQNESEGGGSYINILPLGLHFMIQCESYAH